MEFNIGDRVRVLVLDRIGTISGCFALSPGGGYVRLSSPKQNGAGTPTYYEVEYDTPVASEPRGMHLADKLRPIGKVSR